ncbi:hypothetical protein HAX54_040545 [Datura stramonium]|uniref:Uncharacterized protein n=1 Tax=Datura stramonium TaxID=4076 RepID=A0ABS8SK91_DATST|nr:hypothetical protein [Datura stramonium]
MKVIQCLRSCIQRPPKINGDTTNNKISTGGVGGVHEKPVSGAAVDRRDMLQDKILKVSTPLSMNLVRYQPVLVSKNEGANWRRTTNYY